MIDAIVRMMATGDGVTGPINAGDPTEFSMLDLAKLVVDPTIRAGAAPISRRRRSSCRGRRARRSMRGLRRTSA